MASYLLSFDQSRLSRDDVVEIIDKIDDIKNWLFFFDNTACVVSDLSADELADLIRSELPDAHFIVVNLEKGKRGGWLRKSVWNFIKDPKPVRS